MPDHRYPALRVQQSPDGTWLVLFAAPATDIDRWGGVPQKKQLGDAETTGFQREVNGNRLKQLKAFYADPRNVVQNPLLCATRSHAAGHVRFEPSVGNDDATLQHGSIVIVDEDLESLPLLELLLRMRGQLEARVPGLSDHAVEASVLTRLREQAKDAGHASLDEEQETVDQYQEANGTDLAAVVEDESHILDFYDEVAARIVLLEELGDSFSGDDFLGYTKSAMASYLKPVAVVDGQHRLAGAIAAAKAMANDGEEHQDRIAELIDKGHSPDEATTLVEGQLARRLPVSLLLTDDPAEHVFQFVIVNQKATPIGKPLLGTIISTTLSNDELRGVSERLMHSGIALEDSRAIASLTRDENSPFFGLVERGLATESAGLLTWSVFGSIVRIFRELNGGKLFGERNDYADRWKRLYLPKSGLVAGWEDRGYDDPFEYWREVTGPWRTVFVSFWSAVRDRFGNTEDPEAENYWGDPRSSNLFNKVSLTILASDFFQFLCERALTVTTEGDVEELVALWLQDVSNSYFSRDWNLGGVKKDSTGIRNRWARLWVEYRKDPTRLPGTNQYRSPLNPS